MMRKGDDISITDIPEDMQEEAELYHTELDREESANWMTI